MSVYINDYKVDPISIGLVNNTGLLASYKWARDTDQDNHIYFNCGEYDDLVIFTHYIENRAIVNSEIMAHIWYYHPEFINGEPDTKYIYDLINKYGANNHINLILKNDAESRDFTADLIIVDKIKYHIECPIYILKYIKVLDFYGYKFIPSEHLIDFETGDYLYAPEAEIADIENSKIIKDVPWKNIIDMLSCDDCEFSYGKYNKMFTLAKKYNRDISVFTHYTPDGLYIFIGYLRLWKYGEKKNKAIKTDIMNISSGCFIDEYYYIKNDPLYMYLCIICMIGCCVFCGIPIFFTILVIIIEYAL